MFQRYMSKNNCAVFCEKQLCGVGEKKACVDLVINKDILTSGQSSQL